MPPFAHGDTKYWFIDNEPTVASQYPLCVYRRVFCYLYFTSDYLRLYIYSDTSLTFLSGSRLTATFKNIGQNKALEINKRHQFLFAWIPLELTDLWPCILLFSVHQVCTTPVSCASEWMPLNVVFSSFLSTSLSTISSHVFFYTLLFPRLLQGFFFFTDILCSLQSTIRIGWKRFSSNCPHSSFLNSTIQRLSLVFSSDVSV